MGEPLEELLRKAHRDEVLPLAVILGIKPGGMKLDELVQAIGATLRRKAASDLANILLRRGEGPSYGAVLRHLAARMGVEVEEQAEVADVEALLAEAHTRATFGALSPEQRERRWSRAEGQPPTPEEGTTALMRMEPRDSRGWAYRLMQLATEPQVPLPGCLFLAWLMRPRFDVVAPAVLEVARLRQTVRHRVTIGVVGSPSSGKDAALAALFGVQTGNVNPVAGSTRAVEIRRLDGPTALFLVNTPGLGDVVQEVTEQAREVLHHIDLYLYVVNAQGGVQAREKADYDACVATGRPVLAVVNKVDTLREADRARYLADAREKLGAPADAFLATAFDPLPQLAPEPVGIPAVRQWLAEQLTALGKDPEELPWMHQSTSVKR